MNKTIIICGAVLVVSTLYSDPKPSVEAIMYLDTEMPCRQDEVLSGKIIIRNNGDDDIQLLEGTSSYPELLVHHQLYVFPDIHKEGYNNLKTHSNILAERDYRQRAKFNVEHESKNLTTGLVTLKKGASLEVRFDDLELYMVFGNHKLQVPYVVELYLSPDTWIPVKVQPSIEVSYNSKAVKSIKEGKRSNDNEPWAWRIHVGTNEFLFTKLNSSSRIQRLLEIQPDDIAVYTNQEITVTRRNGDVLVFPEQDFTRISAERKEKIRKRRQLETSP